MQIHGATMLKTLFFQVAVITIGLLQSGAGALAGEYNAQPMQPNPPEKCSKAGLAEGMPLFPSKPVAGHPGADPAIEERAWLWDEPELINYAGSIEHYRVGNQKYIKPINRFNHRTLIKNFIAAEMKGVGRDRIELFAEPEQYVRKGHNPQVLYSGKMRPPVEVVRLRPGGKRLNFKIGPLPTSFYVVRIIGALLPADATLGKPKKDLIVDMRINDGPNGEENHYVLRQHGTDNFYSLGEFFFHVEDTRVFNISVGVHKDARADLMTYNVDVHDALAECARRAGKTRSVLVNVKAMEASWLSEESKQKQEQEKERIERQLTDLRKEFPDKDDVALMKLRRARRDEFLWYSMVPLNSHYAIANAPNVPSAPDPQTAAALKSAGLVLDDSLFNFGYAGYRESKFWRFDLPDPRYGIGWHAPWRLFWKKADGTVEYYTRANLSAQDPLPGLPFAVPPWGKRFETKDGPTWLYPQIQGLCTAYYKLHMYFCQPDKFVAVNYNKYGLMDVTRDNALLLCSFAYNLPSHIESHAIGHALSGPFINRLAAHQHRRRNYQFDDYNKLVEFYDRLFPFIKDNQELATAVGRYIKWVKTPEDVIALLDTYLVQYAAKEALYMRYYYNYGHAGFLAQFAAIQGDLEISEPWVKAAYERSWEYPARSYVGVQDLLYYTVQRDGTANIGSFSYAHAVSSATLAADWIEKWIAQGGDSHYRLADPKRYPRATEFPNWLLESRVAGFQGLCVGDVSGPSRPYGYGFVKNIQAWASKGWTWTRDPRFAYCLVNYSKRGNETDEEWQRIESAANGVRNPLMANRSRILTDWGGILEGGTQSDDFRFRHAMRVRIGTGTGHAHQDTLDLGLWSLGLLLAPDMGARGGYGRPGVKSSVMHNTVTTAGKEGDDNFSAYAWVPEPADMENVQYLRALSTYGGFGRHSERQVAIIEIDKGRAARNPPSNRDLRPGTKYDPDIVFPRAYFVDIFRKGGGEIHKYNFHGPTEDEFRTSLTRGALSDDEAAWAEKIRYVVKGEQWAADIDSDLFTATWRMGRTPFTFHAAERGERDVPAPEPRILGSAYDAGSPRKYIRLHMPGQKGRRVVSGVAVSAPYGEGRTDGDWLRNIHVIHKLGKDETSLFAAILEPFAGRPFIKSVSFEGDVNDRRSMAVLHVETLDGVRDINFADMRNAPERTLRDGTRIQGSFAYVSRDADGLRQASLVNGTKLEIPELLIEPERNTWSAKVASIDYRNRTMTLDRPLPDKILNGNFFEVGLPADQARHMGAHWTTFKAAQVSGKGTQSTLRWVKGAEVYGGRILSIHSMKEARIESKKESFYPKEDENSMFIKLGLSPSVQKGNVNQLVIAGEDGKRTGICKVSYSNLICDPATVPPGMFKAGERIKLYDIGVGHTVRFSTRTSLVHASGEEYTLSSNVPLSLTIRGKKTEFGLKDIQGLRTIRVRIPRGTR